MFSIHKISASLNHNLCCLLPSNEPEPTTRIHKYGKSVLIKKKNNKTLVSFFFFFLTQPLLHPPSSTPLISSYPSTLINKNQVHVKILNKKPQKKPKKNQKTKKPKTKKTKKKLKKKESIYAPKLILHASCVSLTTRSFTPSLLSLSHTDNNNNVGNAPI